MYLKKEKKKKIEKRIKNIMMTATDMQPRAPHAHKLQSHKAQTRSRTAEHQCNARDKGSAGEGGCLVAVRQAYEIMPRNS